jgi:hypothetical protein
MAAWPQLSPRSPTTDGTYFPHPAPNAAGNEDASAATMGAASSIFKVGLSPPVLLITVD